MNDDRPGLRLAYLLTGATAATMATASAGGVFATDWLYRDNALITATFRGQDMVTLVVAVPLLLVGLVWEMRGSTRGRVLWLGMFFYSMYAYLFYAVAAAFNQFFLLYVATFGLPLYALLFSVPRLDLTQLGGAMGGRVARLVAITYTGVVAAGLGLLWVGISLSYLVTDDVPQPIVDSGHPTGVVFAIDLVFIVPPMLLAARLAGASRAARLAAGRRHERGREPLHPDPGRRECRGRAPERGSRLRTAHLGRADDAGCRDSCPAVRRHPPTRRQ